MKECARDQRNCHIDEDQCWKNLPQGNQIILKATHDTSRAVGKILRVQVQYFLGATVVIALYSNLLCFRIDETFYKMKK